MKNSNNGSLINMRGPVKNSPTDNHGRNMYHFDANSESEGSLTRDDGTLHVNKRYSNKNIHLSNTRNEVVLINFTFAILGRKISLEKKTSSEVSNWKKALDH